MQVILLQRVAKLGQMGEVVNVKDGYARNYLIPRGFAVVWSKGGEKQIDQIRAARTARALATVEEAQSLKAAIEAKPIKLVVKAGEGGRLFGAVKTADIVKAVADAGLGELDKRKIEFVAPIRSTGTHAATVRLHGDLSARITLAVVAAK
jgi:large subunit ribosomal protein L9